MSKKSSIHNDRVGATVDHYDAKASANAAFTAYVAEYKAASPELYDSTDASALRTPLKPPNRKRFSLVNNRNRSDDKSCITESTSKASNVKSRGGTANSARRQSKPMRLISNAVKVTKRSITSSSNAKVNTSKQGVGDKYSITLPDGLIRDVRGSVLATLLDFSLTELGRHMGNREREDSFSTDARGTDDSSEEHHQCPKAACYQRSPRVRKQEKSVQSQNEPTESEGTAVMAAQFDHSGSVENLTLPNSKLTIRGVKMVEAKTEKGSTKLVPMHQKGKIISYRSAEGIVEALIVDVHLDDLYEPYYTIRFTDGREKQTDNDHILLIPDIVKPKIEVTESKKNVREDSPGSVVVPCPSNRPLVEPMKKPTYRQQARKSITQFAKNVIDTSQGRGNNEEQASYAPMQNGRSNSHDKSSAKSSGKSLVKSSGKYRVKSSGKASDESNTKSRDKLSRNYRDESDNKKSRHCSHDAVHDNSHSRSNNNGNDLLQKLHSSQNPLRCHISSSTSLSALPEEAEKALAKVQSTKRNVEPRSDAIVVLKDEMHAEAGRSKVKSKRKTIKNMIKLKF